MNIAIEHKNIRCKADFEKFSYDFTTKEVIEGERFSMEEHEFPTLNVVFDYLDNNEVIFNSLTYINVENYFKDVVPLYVLKCFTIPTK